ncbi:MAG: FHA domain-containing protein [bacterium]
MTDRDETISGSLKERAGEASLPGGLLVTLEVVEGPDKGAKFEIKRSRTTLGRKDADVKLSDPTVSGKHAVLEYVGGKLFVTDNNSTNGTAVNGEPVESSRVYNLDEIQVGDTVFMLSMVEDRYADFYNEQLQESEEPVPEEDEPTVVEKPLLNPELPDNLAVALEVIEGPDKGKKLKLARRSTIIGRGKQADFVTDDPKVSNRHCQVEIHNKDKMTIKDLASANGTRLNNRYVSAVKLRDKDVIHIGDSKIKLHVRVRM